MRMALGGWQPLSLSDFPGHPAAIVFTQGCNLRCPWCHNSSLWPFPEEAGSGEGSGYRAGDILSLLEERRGRLRGLVITGGEPTLQPDLPLFIQAVHALGIAVKLDTNGTRPDILEKLIGEGLLHMIAMDIKAPPASPEKYARLAGTEVDMAALTRSISILGDAAAIGHCRVQFRTTRIPGLLTEEDMRTIRDTLPPNTTWQEQDFVAELAAFPTGCRL